MALYTESYTNLNDAPLEITYLLIVPENHCELLYC